MRGAWVYIVTNRPNGILYTGVTSNLARRAFEHRTGAVAGFTKRHGLKRAYPSPEGGGWPSVGRPGGARSRNI